MLLGGSHILLLGRGLLQVRLLLIRSLVEEPVLRLILVHLGPESLEGRKPERDYVAQDFVVVTGLPILGNSL